MLKDSFRTFWIQPFIPSDEEYNKRKNKNNIKYVYKNLKPKTCPSENEIN